MPNNYRMSYFMPPIAPIKDKQGRLMTPPTLIPFCEVSIEQVFQMITCNENLKALTEQVRNSEDIRTAKASLLPKTLTAQVRNATDIRTAKASLLPYVTPCGTFTRRSSKDFVSPSHLVIVDVDGLHSYQEAVEMRRMLYDDPLLQPVLTFVSPSGLGVKAFVPCHYSSTTNDIPNITDNMSWAMRYVETAYNTVTASGKDLVRSCFLSYDPEALFRTTNE